MGAAPAVARSWLCSHRRPSGACSADNGRGPPDSERDMGNKGKKWVIGLPVLAVLGLVLVLGRGVTGKATGGANEAQGCGGDAPGAVGTEKSAATVTNSV